MEGIMHNIIVDFVGFEPSSIDVTLASSLKCKKLKVRRPNFMYVLEKRNVPICMKIDEDSHTYYESSCAISKISR